MAFLLLGLVALLAFANGANDNCKGVATLVGYGAAKPREALLWAALTTAAGAAASFWLAGGLLKAFSVGLFERGTALDPGFFISVLAGSFAWVLLATWAGLPVSTTHAITGALTGAGLLAFGGHQFQWTFLGTKFGMPLALGPLASMALVYVLAWPVMAVTTRIAGRCVCVVPIAATPPAAGSAAMAAAASARVDVVVAEDQACARQDPVIAVSGSRTANAVHWLSSGLVGFARGWNDAPKIAALGLIALTGPGGLAIGFAVVTLAMALGGLLAGRKVLETLARKVTPMPLAESLTASLVTAGLVGLASWNGLPVSATHVSTGAIVGAGLKRDPGSVRWGKVGEIVLSWLLTLPTAAAIAAAAALALRHL